MFNEEEFNDWLLHPVTKSLKQLLAAKRERLRRQWEGGSFTDYTKEGTVLVNVGNVGICRGLAFVEDLDYETFDLELDDE